MLFKLKGFEIAGFLFRVWTENKLKTELAEDIVVTIIGV